jgi:acyl carrier protein
MSEELKATILHILGTVAPDADLGSIEGGVDLRDQLDIDSMDLLNFAIGLNKEFGIDIPEADYPKLVTLDGCIGYVEAKRGPA